MACAATWDVNSAAPSPLGALKRRFPRAVHALEGMDSLSAGDRRSANRGFEEAWADGPGSLALDYAYTATLGGLAKLAAGLGRVEEARELDTLLEPFDGQFLLELLQNISGSVPFLRGLLACTTGDLDAGIAHFERAVEMETRNGLSVLLVGTQVHLAEALVARGAPGDALRAHELAAAAHAEAERITMRPVVERAAALLV